MTDLEKLSKALPKKKGINHLENLKKVYAKSEWHGVHYYVINILQKKIFKFL